MPLVGVAGVDVHFIEHGAAAADAVHTAVFLHGFTLDHRSNVAAFEPSFAARPHWRRVYLDFPGMGATKAPASLGSTDGVFAVTKAAIDELVPSSYAVVGGSYGCYIALGLTAAAPEQVTGVALYVPMVVPDNAARNVPLHRVLVREPSLPPGSEDFEEIAVVITADTLRRTSAEVDAAIEIADEAAIERIAEHYAGTFPLAPATGPYDRPTLVMTGRQDSVTGYSDPWAMLGQWPRSTFVVLDRAGHNLHIEQPGLFAALVEEWLDRIEENVA